MNWLHYLIEANLYLGVFYMAYLLFLSKETYYTLNRVYLLFSCLVSFALPVMQLGILKPVEPQITAVHFTPVAQNFIVSQVQFTPTPALNWQDAIVYIYLLGVAVLSLALLLKLYQLLKLTRVQNTGPDCRYKLIHINQPNIAFSFFNYLFIGTSVNEAETIIEHELVHISQKHSADIIFIELLKIVNWFNPFVYLLQRSIRAVHEYIADEKIAASGADTIAYSSFLVNNAYGLSGSSITHSFFNYNLLKKRIIMLHQKRSGSLARLKYLLAVPICGGLLCASTLAFSKTYGFIDIGPHRIDKNNKSAQVVEPAKRLLVRERGTSVITDKFSYKFPDGTVKYYTTHNLSNLARKDLKAMGITVDIISDVRIDTIKSHIASPPPPTPPITAVKFPEPKHSKLTTSKGYKYFESGYVINGKSHMRVSIFEKNGDLEVFDKSLAKPADIAMLKDKYGYVFPSHFKIPPPPPPAPPAPKVIKFPPPTVVGLTKKGYKYSEDGYLIDGKTDFRVIITEKNGDQKEYFKSKASNADVKLLSEKYGYKFPVMQIYTKLPPPPPTAPGGPTGIEKRPPPPPPAPPSKTGMIIPKDKDSTIKAKKAVTSSASTTTYNGIKLMDLIPGGDGKHC